MTATVPDSAAWTPKAFSTPHAVRRHNLGVVLRHVIGHGPRSRATIAQETGLNKTTVSRLVGELIELGLLLERGIEARGTAGRPGQVVDVARDGAVALGLEINVDYLSVQATDLAGGSRYRAREGGDNRGQDAGAVLDRLAALAGGALDEVRAQGVRAIGATVALPGLVDVAGGTLLAAPNLGWSDVAIVDELRARIAAPLSVDADNEANLAALAELWEGVAVGVADFMYASGQVGVGGGIVLGGELFRGYSGFGGELGHMVIDAAGAPCACGSRGCLETRCGLEPLLGIGRRRAAGDRVGPARRRPRAARPRAGSRRARRLGRMWDLARNRARQRREPAEPAGRRARRLFRPDRDLARARDRARAGRTRARRLRPARPDRQPRRRRGRAGRRRNAAPSRPRGPAECRATKLLRD